MRTVLALLVAAGLVAGAVVYRGQRAGEPGITLGPRGGPVTLLCATEVAEACRAIAGEDLIVVVQEAGETAQVLSRDDPGEADAWLAPAPYPQIVAENRERNGLPALPPVDAETLARSPLLIAVESERAAVLAEHCGSAEWSWACVATVADAGSWADVGGQQRWGRPKPGYPEPTTSATGLLVAAQASADVLGGTFAARDLDTDAFLDGVAPLERAVPDHGTPTNTPLRQMVTFGPASIDVAGALEAQAAPLFTRSGSRVDDLELRLGRPVATADLLLAPLRPEGAAAVRAAVTSEAGMAALTAAGWRVEGAGPPEGSPAGALPDGNGLPSPGVVEALRLRWSEIGR